MKEDCTYFDKYTSFRGSISTPDEVVVEGSVYGEVEAARKVTILSGAEVRGPIRTPKILLQEGAYHLGALSLSDLPGAIPLADLDRVRPARYATSTPQASPEQANGERAEDAVSRGNGEEEAAGESFPDLPDSKEEVREKKEEHALPAGFGEETDPSDRLW